MNNKKPSISNKSNTKNNHWGVFIDNSSDKSYFLEELLSERKPKSFEFLAGLKGDLFSKLALIKLLNEESRHGDSGITSDQNQSLQTMSSGEQKKALLKHLLKLKPDFLILDNPFDNLDKDFQIVFKEQLNSIANNVFVIQIISRQDDLLPFVSNYAYLRNKELDILSQQDLPTRNYSIEFNGKIPEPLYKTNYNEEILIALNKVNVSYDGRPILRNISWTINKGEFWELSGKNGSGKTTILSMITGENPKGYGQDLYLFGHKKGSGESVWDIKKNIGYFTPAMTDKFTGYHSVEHMMISGILDSVGLYVQPTETQLRLAKQWLQLINMWHLKDTLYHDLTLGQRRLIMTTRAMVKHPLLLILDEPTVGLDDNSASLLVSLVNKMSIESNTSIIFVSHRQEKGLSPRQQLLLYTSEYGSTGKTIAK